MENTDAILKFFKNKDMLISQVGKSNKIMFDICVSSCNTNNEGVLVISILSDQLNSDFRHYHLKGRQIVDLMKHGEYIDNKYKIFLSKKKAKWQ